MGPGGRLNIAWGRCMIGRILSFPLRFPDNAAAFMLDLSVDRSVCQSEYPGDADTARAWQGQMASICGYEWLLIYRYARLLFKYECCNVTHLDASKRTIGLNADVQNSVSEMKTNSERAPDVFTVCL